MTDETERVAREAARLVDQIRPIFAGKNPDVVGAALADLTAIWAAGHVVPHDKDATDSLRAHLLAVHIEGICSLVGVNADMLGATLMADEPGGNA